MKNLRYLLSAFLLVYCTVAMAETVTIGGITYDVIVKAKQASVIAKETGEYSGSVVIPETIVHNNVTYSVTSIGNYAFSRCSGLTSITIPNSVTSIGGYAFFGCSGLTSITIPNSVITIADRAFYNCDDLTNVTIGNNVTSIGGYAFQSCDGLTSITIPNSVTTIGDYAFKGCSYLTCITIPNSITSIGKGAFYECSSLTNVTIGNGVTSIGQEAFYYCSRLTNITIPTSVTSIGNYSFYYCCALTSITIPNSVTSIGDGAFYNCSGLTSITIPNSVTSIGDQALYNCSGLTSVTIGNSVTSIGDQAFYNCSGLTSVTIGNSVTSIGDYAFKGCSGLTSITIPNSVTTIGYSAFYGCSGLKDVHISDLTAWCNISFEGSTANPLVYAHNLYLNGELVTDLVIPNNVTSIGDGAFYNCSSLTSITIPNSVTTIGDYAFKGCDKLTAVHISDIDAWCKISFGDYESNPLYYTKKIYMNGNLITDLVIPNSITSVGSYAFYNCSSLTSITIPNSVTSIGNGAFYNCSGLTSMTIGRGVKNIYSEAFAECKNLTDVYCLATTVPSTFSDAFNESYPEYMTLHVPAEAINSYKTKAPWSSFGKIVTLYEEDIVEPEVKICATPVISYSNGKLSFECETEGAEFITDVTCSDIKKFYDSEINFSATYNISVYATANGYDNSDTVNATLCWIENGESDNTNNIINVPAVAVLVTSANGVVTVSCSLEGETVAVYTTDGTLVGSAAITNGSATIQSGLSKGSVAIVKIGNKSVKVVVD